MSWILSLLGFGGIAGGLALFFIPGARELIGKLIGSLSPRMVWALVAMVGIVALGVWHFHTVAAARSAGEKAGRDRANAEWNAAFAKMHYAADQWRSNFENRGRTITRLLEKDHAKTLADNRARADDLRLRGPGQAGARCPGYPRLAGGAGGNGNPATGPGAPAGGVPAQDRGTDWAVVPWGWLIKQAEEKDQLLAEAKLWRSWYDQQGLLHRQMVDRAKVEWPEPALSAGSAEKPERERQ